MVEWFKAAVLKTAVGQLTEGSNPSSSAIFFAQKMANEAASLLFFVHRSFMRRWNAATATLHPKSLRLACEVAHFIRL